MLVDQDQDPSRSIYFIGAKIIEALKDSNFAVIAPNYLYSRINSETTAIGFKIPFDYYLLALDWLFILGSIKADEKGDLIKCF